jgi:hypothetical protein
LLLDLASADRLDGRPLLALLGGGGVPASAEPTAWFPPEAISLSATAADDAGSTYHTLRGERSLLLTRIGTGRHRAADDDQQAVELFIAGARVVLDPGTFRYSGRPPWRQPFTAVTTHSTCAPSATVTALAPARAMGGLGRFLRAPMPPARVVRRSRSSNGEQLVSERTDQGVRLTRNGDRYAVVDMTDGGPATVHWLIRGGDAPAPEWEGIRFVDQCTCDFAIGPRPRVRRLSEDDPGSGWWSPTYGELAGAVALDVEVDDGDVAVARFASSDEGLLSLTEIAELLGDDPLGKRLRDRARSSPLDRRDG